VKKLREIHLYLGCLFAPILIFFAVTGAWQLFGLHHGRKDGSYRPPTAFVLLSSVHVVQHIPPTNSNGPTPLRYFILAASLGLVLTSVLGIIMAFRFGHKRAVILSVISGVVIPVAILLIYH
jgi:hypothetical protein